MELYYQKIKLSKQEMELFIPYHTSDQQTSLAKVCTFSMSISKQVSETVNGSILTENPII